MRSQQLWQRQVQSCELVLKHLRYVLFKPEFTTEGTGYNSKTHHLKKQYLIKLKIIGTNTKYLGLPLNKSHEMSITFFDNSSRID